MSNETIQLHGGSQGRRQLRVTHTLRRYALTKLIHRSTKVESMVRVEEIRLIHVLERDILMLTVQRCKLLQNIHDRSYGNE